MSDRPQMITPTRWQREDDGSAATPKCPQCRAHLGIRLGMWRDNGRDAWFCKPCGEEWESVEVAAP